VSLLWSLVRISVQADILSGGSGAGPDWDGQNCVQVHMTNVSSPNL